MMCGADARPVIVSWRLVPAHLRITTRTAPETSHDEDAASIASERRAFAEAARIRGDSLNDRGTLFNSSPLTSWGGTHRANHRASAPRPRFPPNVSVPDCANLSRAIRKIVIGVGPVGEAFDPPLEWNGVG